MCKIMEDLVNDAIMEDRKKQNAEKAKKMLRDGMLSHEAVAEYSGLTLEEVKELALQSV